MHACTSHPLQECQAVRTELQRTVAEKESLSLKIQEYAQSLLQAEKAIAVKERERSELVESYRALSEEADKLDSSVQLSLGENSATKLELSTIVQVTCSLILGECCRILSSTTTS